MSLTLKPYPAYKDSGLPWAGQVPNHWILIPNRGLVRKRKFLVGSRHTEYVLLSLTKQGVIIRDLSSEKGKFSSDMGTSQEVRKGDLVFCLFDVPETPRTVGLSRYDGMITGAYTVFEPALADIAPYFELFYRAMDDRKLLSPLYSGLRHTIPVDRFLAAKTPQPPLEEQRSIVLFLRHFDAQTSKLIRAKRRVIELLNEQKQATIEELLLKGANTVPQRTTGLYALPAVPSGWTLKKFKFLTTLKSGQVDPRIAPYRSMALIAPNHIESGTGRVLATETADEQGAESGKYLAAPGQIVYSKIRPYLRKATIVDRECLCSADMYPITVEESELDVRFALLLMLSRPFTRQVVDLSMRAAIPKVNREALGNAWLWFPKLAVQQALLKEISDRNHRLEQAVISESRQITLLCEYRARLIADVVTGKLDVRGVELPHVEELAEAETIGEADVEDGSDIDDEAAAEASA